MEAQAPSPTASNGRDPETGRFAAGNKLAVGNPFSRRVGELRSALLDEVTEEHFRGIVKVLVKQALCGDIVACREVLLRVLGRPLEADLLERIEQLEARLGGGDDAHDATAA